MKTDKELLKRCTSAWMNLASFRQRRERCKKFVYGEQWSDATMLPDGRITDEGELMRLKGRMPVTNNLIRQLVKGIIGRYRYLSNNNDTDTPLQLGNPGSEEELDARALEEFLISGSAFQRVEKRKVENVAPRRIFFSRFSSGDGADCRMIGMLHDMDAGELIRAFSGGKAEKAAAILNATFPAAERNCDPFSSPEDEGCTRVIEVWEKRALSIISIHDPEKGDYAKAPCTAEILAGITSANRIRSRKGKKALTFTLLHRPMGADMAHPFGRDSLKKNLRSSETSSLRDGSLSIYRR